MALYQKGITIYISPNTNDNPEWQATIQHIAIEGKCFFVNADMVIRRESYPSDLHEGDVASRFPEYVCRGGSCIVDPRGHYVTEPVWDEEAIIYAVPSRFLRTFRQPHRPAVRCGYPSSRVTSR